MQTMEFKTTINEPYIKIPNFDIFKGCEVEVILKMPRKNQNKRNTKGNLDFFDKYQKDLSADDFINLITKNPKHIGLNNSFFSRDEANER
jgi:ribosome maturation factor RimP